jgi:MFS family permease
LIFAACGFAFATWASRLVAIRLTLGVDPGRMGLLLLFWSAGSMAAMPVAGALVQRLGGRRVMAAFSCLALAGLLGAGVFSVARSPLGVAGLLVVLGVGIGVWDVAMNIAAMDVERALGRSIMPRFHAGYSLGTVVAGGVGAGLARLGVPVVAHFGAAAAICLAALAWGLRTLLPGGMSAAAPRASSRPPSSGDPGEQGDRSAAAPRASSRPPTSGDPGEQGDRSDAAAPASSRPPTSGQPGGATGPGRSPGSAWAEPRILLLGVVVLALSLTEGAAGDWLASGVVQGFGAPESTGILGLTIFLTAQTTVRLLGTGLVDRFGRVAAIRASAVVAAIGLLLYGLAPSLPLVFTGAALWGMGAALVFPLGMSAAGDDPSRAAGRTSVVATIGYGAFLTGPPLLGLLADQLGFRHAMLVLLAPVALAIGLASVARKDPAAKQLTL